MPFCYLFEFGFEFGFDFMFVVVDFNFDLVFARFFSVFVHVLLVRLLSLFALGRSCCVSRCFVTFEKKKQFPVFFPVWLTL